MEIKRNFTADDILYPKGNPYRTGWLDVGDGHSLYYQEYGNPKGAPALVIHGGPGGSIPEGSRAARTHDPIYFRIICVDQRGCGESKPHVAHDRKAALKGNTPDKLVQDFEKIREFLHIRKWHVSGYSWGSCLAMLYAAKYPDRFLSLVIGGVWMHTPDEIDWYFNRMDYFVPEAADDLLKALPRSTNPRNRMSVLARLITGKDHKRAVSVAEALGRFEAYAVCFDPQVLQTEQSKMSAAQKKKYELMMVSLGALECYFMYKSPLAPGWYATPASRKAISSIPVFEIVQARYDLCTPPLMAYQLHKLYPHSHLTIAQFANHTLNEPEIARHYVAALNRLKT